MLMQPLVQQIYDVVAVNPHLNHSRMQLEAQEADGTVTLRGEVKSFYEKQMVQESLRRIDGVKVIENQLEVID